MRRECRERFPGHIRMSGLLTRGSGENVPGIAGACTTCNFTFLLRRPWWRFFCSMVTMSSDHNGIRRLNFYIGVQSSASYVKRIGYLLLSNSVTTLWKQMFWNIFTWGSTMVSGLPATHRVHHTPCPTPFPNTTTTTLPNILLPVCKMLTATKFNRGMWKFFIWKRAHKTFVFGSEWREAKLLFLLAELLGTMCYMLDLPVVVIWWIMAIVSVKRW